MSPYPPPAGPAILRNVPLAATSPTGACNGAATATKRPTTAEYSRYSPPARVVKGGFWRQSDPEFGNCVSSSSVLVAVEFVAGDGATVGWVASAVRATGAGVGTTVGAADGTTVGAGCGTT